MGCAVLAIRGPTLTRAIMGAAINGMARINITSIHSIIILGRFLAVGINHEVTATRSGDTDVSIALSTVQYFVLGLCEERNATNCSEFVTQR